jgi:hypothetical protein
MYRWECVAGGAWTVRRAEALEDWSAAAAAADARSLFARPFPFDADVDALTTLFAAHGTVNAVRAPPLSPAPLLLSSRHREGQPRYHDEVAEEGSSV